MSDRFRILVLDGGGMKGAFTAGALAELEAQTKKSVVDHFDLIVGTSTGGIIAIGLGLGMGTKEIKNLYCESGHKIFSGRTALSRFGLQFRHLLRAKHTNEGLRNVLKPFIEGKKLGHSSKRLVIPTFDALKGHACTFKTAHHVSLKNEYNLNAINVAVATAAAPTYFPGVEIEEREGALYLDGGVWANCPAVVGIVEAMHFLSVPLDKIHVLSVGCTSAAEDFVARKNAGIFGWNKALLSVCMAGQMNSAEHIAKLLIGERFYRINAPAGKRPYRLDDGRGETARELSELGASVCRARDVIDRVESDFMDGSHAKKFVPVYEVSDMEPQVGQVG